MLAPAVMTFSAFPGDWIVPAPGPLFPAAMATTRPASTAWLTAFSSGSFFLTTSS